MTAKIVRVYIPNVGETNMQVDSGTPYQVDAVQKYPLGTKIRFGDRTYVYAKAGGTCNPEVGAYKAKKTNTVVVAPTQATGAGVAGSSTITVTIDTHIGVLATGVLSENELAGGYVVIGNGSAQHPQNRQIVSHPALATTGGALTLTLDSPLVTTITAAVTTIELMESPYYNVIADQAGGEYVSFIGVPTVVATSGQYLWIQTWGPCWITSDMHTCDSVNDRAIYFVANGSVVSGGSLTYQGSGYQRAGFALDMSGSGASNAPFVMLQITP